MQLCRGYEHEEFYFFQKNNSLYKGNLKILEQIEGKIINFGVGEVDENYLAIQDLFFNKVDNSSFQLFSDSEKNSENKFSRNSNKSISGECIVCHNNIKESVFVPCGHKCVCYNCAVIVFAVHKKCPKCKKDATCIIKKVYD